MEEIKIWLMFPVLLFFARTPFASGGIAFLALGVCLLILEAARMYGRNLTKTVDPGTAIKRRDIYIARAAVI